MISLGAEAMVPFTEEVKDLLTHKDKFEEEYRMFRHEGGPYCWVPRGLVNRGNVQHDHRVDRPCPQLIAHAPPIDQDQRQVIDKSVALLKAGQDHIVEAPTGFGKTYVGSAISCLLGQKTLVVVTKNDLSAEWHRTFKHLIGLPEAEIGHVQQNTLKYADRRIVTAMIHTLISREYPQEFYQAFGLVIFDEVHRLGSQHFAQVCSMFPSKHRLGLSATTNRSDGRQRLFHAHIGPVLVKGMNIPMSPKVLVKRTGYKLPLEARRDDDGIWKKLPMLVTPGRMMNVVEAMAADPVRNGEIAAFVAQAYAAGRAHTVVMAETLDHLQRLFHTIVAKGVPGQDIGFYHGQLKPYEQALGKTKRVVLCTYGYTSEGTNVPAWDTLVMATPRANVKQPVGRVIRKIEGKRTPIVLDLVDANPTLNSFYFARLKTYYELKAEVVEV